MSKKDYYDILGVTKKSTPEEIKKAYRSLAMKYHPDRNQGDKTAEAKFKEASEAYQVLSDPKKKSSYDQFGHSAFEGGGGGAGGFDFGGEDTETTDTETTDTEEGDLDLVDDEEEEEEIEVAPPDHSYRGPKERVIFSINPAFYRPAEVELLGLLVTAGLVGSVLSAALARPTGGARPGRLALVLTSAGSTVTSTRSRPTIARSEPRTARKASAPSTRSAGQSTRGGEYPLDASGSLETPGRSPYH